MERRDTDAVRLTMQAGKEFCRQLVGSDGACVPLEHLASLVEALRDHLLACAPAAAAAASGATKRQGKRKNGAVSRPLSADSQVRVYTMPACMLLIAAAGADDGFRVGESWMGGPAIPYMYSFEGLLC